MLEYAQASRSDGMPIHTEIQHASRRGERIMYIIVAGVGRVGTSFVERATADGNDVVVIEKDSEVADSVAAEYDCLVLNADATDQEILEDAGIERADTVVATTSRDTVNIMVMLQAREYEVPTLVSAVRDASNVPIFEDIGVDIIENPYELIGEHLYHSVRYPGVEDFMPIDEANELIEIVATEDAPIHGMTLEEAKDQSILPDNSLLAVIKRDAEVLTPQGQTQIQTGDAVTVLVNQSSAPDALRAFGHEVNGT